MEMDARMLLTVGGIIVSIASAAAIVRQQLATVIRELKEMKLDYEARLRDLDKRTDRQEVAIDLNAQKTSVLSGLCRPISSTNPAEKSRVFPLWLEPTKPESHT